MTTKPHRHRAIPASHRIVAWTHCVAKGPCSGAAHVGVTHLDTCRCGATRQVESSGRDSASSGWVVAEVADRFTTTEEDFVTGGVWIT